MTEKPNRNRNKTNPKIVKGHELGKGRPRGSQNKHTRLLREAVILAADLEGSDGRGKDGLIGFLRRAATTERAAYLSLMGKLLRYETNVAPRTVDATLSLAERQQRFAEDLKLMRDGFALTKANSRRRIDSRSPTLEKQRIVKRM